MACWAATIIGVLGGVLGGVLTVLSIAFSVLSLEYIPIVYAMTFARFQAIHAIMTMTMCALSLPSAMRPPWIE